MAGLPEERTDNGGGDRIRGAVSDSEQPAQKPDGRREVSAIILL